MKNKVLFDLLHLLLCQKNHESDMMKLLHRKLDVCYYYLEADVAGGGEMENHKEWAIISAQFRQSLGFKSDDEALEFVKKSISISQSVRELTGGNKLKIDFLMSLLS